MARAHFADITVHWSPQERATDWNQAHLWLFDLDDQRDGFPTDTSVLSAEEHARAGRLGSPQRQRRFVARGLLVRHVLGGLLGVEPGAVRFHNGPFGKPELAADSQACGALPRFSLSHSENVLALAVAFNFEVGVDVECVKPGLDFLTVAGTRFTREEIQRLRAIPPGQRAVAFYRNWTRHEAAAKATGRGFAVPSYANSQGAAWESVGWLGADGRTPDLCAAEPGAGSRPGAVYSFECDLSGFLAVGSLAVGVPLRTTTEIVAALG